MLSLHNVSKTYTTKAKTQTQALKNVSLDIASRGMVFILGKSGSGKSTLLNLLGGLDAPTSGEILVDGVSMQQFTPNDYANYRNNYVGFIFQEFNLLSDFNVRDNVALALRLSKAENIDNKVSNALKQVELNEDYLNRRIDEMSGGEKQRIAIARAIIKDSKLILADEPTGNLDSATGESIWNILKSLSSERLVVVVSHDRESAERYADRIIEISDGQIVSDNGTQPQPEEKSQPLPTTKSRLSFVTRLKMGFNNLRLRKVKTVSVILVAIFSILSILIMQMCLCFSPEVAAANCIKKYKLDYFAVSQSGCYDDGQFAANSMSKRMTVASKQYIESNCRSITNGIIQSKQDILDFGLTFVGEALEIDDDSFYTTTSVIEETCYSGYGLVEVDGEYVDIIKELHPIEFLVGKRLGHMSDCILAGVIDADKLANPWALPEMFYTENFAYRISGTEISFNNHGEQDVALTLGDKRREYKFILRCYSHEVLEPSVAVILTANGVLDSTSNIELADNEVILTYELYEKLFDVQSKWYYMNGDLTQVRNMPPEIGQTFNLRIYEYDTGGLIADYGEVKLAGIYFKDSLKEMEISSGEIYRVISSDNLSKKVCFDFSPSSVLIQTASVRNIRGFLTTLRRQYLGCVQNIGIVESLDGDFYDLASTAYDFDNTIALVLKIFLAIGVALTVVLILLIINLISFSITSRKKDIGILSALGTSNKDITSIFLLETLIISAICFAIVLALSFISAVAFNLLWSRAMILKGLIPFICADLLTATVLIAASIGLPLLAALIPIRKIIGLKPIDAIRNV